MIINNFINQFNILVRWPKKRLEKDLAIKWLSEKFNYNKEYSEKEINIILTKNHTFNDIPLLRRELISMKYLNREDDGSKYWKIN